MAVNSKRKGDTFERQIAKTLSSRFEKFLGKKAGFLRNLGSGSRFGGKNAIRASQTVEEAKSVGDILTPLNFKFNIECKFYKDAPTFKSIINGEITQWDKWIQQAKLDNETSGKNYWVIIVKYNLVPPFCILPIDLEQEFRDHILLKYKDSFIVTLERFMGKSDEWYFIDKKGDQ